VRMNTTFKLAAMATSLLALTACGGGGSETAATETAPAAEATAPAAETATAEATAPAAEAAAPAADAAAPAAAAPAAAPAAATVMIAGMAADPANGEKVFRQCMSCHVIEPGQNRVGPSLHGVIGRTAGTVPGFKYSDANKNSGEVWTEEELVRYLENPRAVIPGTIMAFAGLRNPQDRADVVAYIKSKS
jgi:cytochrome c